MRYSVQDAKQIINKMCSWTKENPRPKSGAGIIAMRIARQYFNPKENPDEYKKVYIHTFILLTK